MTDEVWFFALSEHKAYPPRQVFDTPQAAALGAIALHDETIRWANVQKQQMQDWHVRGRFARHTWWPHGRRTPCGGSYREFVREKMKAA